MRKTLVFMAKYIYVLFANYYLFTFGLLSAKRRRVIHMIASETGFPSLTKTVIRIPHTSIDDLVASTALIHLCEQAVIDGNMTLTELLVLNELIFHHKPQVVFEFGTFDGRTTLNMAANTPDDTIVYTLDLPKDFINSTALRIEALDRRYIDKNTSGARYAGTSWEAKVRQLYGDSATFDFSEFVGRVDFVVVDASHSYQYVLSDSRNAIKMLRDGRGVILWHDYTGTGWVGVNKAINELYVKDAYFAKLRYIEGTSFACLICD